MKPHSPLVIHPLGLSRDVSARYIGVKPTLFDQLVADGRMPPPLRINRRKVWNRIEIETAFSLLSRHVAANDHDDENEWDDI